MLQTLLNVVSKNKLYRLVNEIYCLFLLSTISVIPDSDNSEIINIMIYDNNIKYTSQ